MASLVPRQLRRREYGVAALLTVILWVAALFLWMAQDLASGERFPAPYRLVLAETFALGMFFSGILAAVIALVRKWPRVWSVTAIIMATILLAVLHGWLDAHMLARMRIELGFRQVPVLKLFLGGMMPFLLLYGLYAAALALMRSAMATRQREMQLAEARGAAQQAQLAALRFQLNPHFLFNTLNAISSLIVTNRNADAERMTMKLSEFLRISLEADPEAEVTLDEELATTQSYLDIEAVRFGKRLAVEFECPTALLDAHVPSFLLQPLVENSIKYAVAPARHTVTLSVCATARDGKLCLLVEDDGRQAFGSRPSGSTGLGLANVRQRLAAFYGAAGKIAAVATDRGFAVTLILPLRYSATALAAE